MAALRVVSLMAAWMLPIPAAAHIQLLEPQPRYGTALQKDGPCGSVANEPGQSRTSLVSGQQITVHWKETIDHPSHYRIAFDSDGDDDFVDPQAMDDYWNHDSVMVDQIEDMGGGEYRATVTLPRVSCETCTLQLIQVMYDKPPFGNGDDIYYACADLRLEPAGGWTDAGTESDTGDGTTSGDTGEPTTTEPTSGSTTATTGGSAPEAMTETNGSGGADDHAACSIGHDRAIGLAAFLWAIVGFQPRRVPASNRRPAA